ncbi:MAG TPA: hypothetical protein PKJ30_13285, partial [Leptospiraceae bacterium]|nr:hypothetical protein [Leptospiraceae bacterium]
MAFEAGRSLAGSSLMPADIVSFLPARNFTSRVAEPVRPYANYLAGQITSSPQNFSGIVNMSAYQLLFDHETAVIDSSRLDLERHAVEHSASVNPFWLERWHPESDGILLRRMSREAADHNTYKRPPMAASPPWQPSTAYFQSNVVAHGG